MRVLAFDPGKVSGIALFRDVFDPACDSDTDRDLVVPEWRAWMAPWYESLTQVENWIANGHLDLVAVERFTVSARTMSQGADHTWPTGGIGVALYLCQKHGVPVVLQSPADAKNFAPRPVLVKLGWRTKGKDHPDDATRHLVLALANRGYQPLLRRLAVSA